MLFRFIVASFPLERSVRTFFRSRFLPPPPSTSLDVPFARNSSIPREALQEHRRAERDEPVEPSERPIRHQEVHPRVHTEAATQQVARRDLVGCRHLELELLEAEDMGA